MIGIVEPRSGPESKQVRGVEIGVVQSIHIGAKRFPQRARQLLLAGNGLDGSQMRLHRRQPAGFYGRFRHERIVEIGDLPGAGAGRGRGFGGFADQRRGPLVRQVGKFGKHAHPGTVRRNDRPLDPCAIGISIKIIARRHRAVHVLHRNAVPAGLGCPLLRMDQDKNEKKSQNQECQS